MKTSLLLLVSLFCFAFQAPLRAQAPAGMSKVEADAYNAAYAAEMARLLALKPSGQADPLAAPVKPGPDATKTDWDKYDNAVSAWNQRTELARQQQIAAQQRQRQEIAATADHLRRERLAAAAERKKAEDEAAYQRWIQLRQTLALEALARGAGRGR